MVEAVAHVEPLLHRLGRRVLAIRFAFAHEVPGAAQFLVLVALQHDAGRLGILRTEFTVGIVRGLLLVDVVSYAHQSEVVHIVVVGTGAEKLAPRFQQVLDVVGGFLHGWNALAQLHHLLAGRLASAAALGILFYRSLPGVESLQILGVCGESLGIPVEEGSRVVGESAHAGNVAALLVGWYAKQTGEVIHRLAHHHVEEFHHGNLVVIDGQVTADESDTHAAGGDVSGHHMRVSVRLQDDALHLLRRNLVDIHGNPVGRLGDVGNLLAQSVHEGGSRDTRHHDLGAVGERLADRQLLAVEFGAVFGHGIKLDDSLELLLVDELMTFAGSDGAEERG